MKIFETVRYWLFGTERRSEADVLGQRLDKAVHKLDLNVQVLKNLTTRMQERERKRDVDWLVNR